MFSQKVEKEKKKKKTVSAQGFVRGEARQSTQRRKGSVQATVGLSRPPLYLNES